MGSQYKLFKIFESDKTRQELIELFNENNIWDINSNLIGISYDYNANQYRDVLNKVYNLNVSQKIITSRTFIKIMKKCVEKEYFLRKIDFIESIPEDVADYIRNNIEKLNSNKNIESKNVFEEYITNELNWLRNNDGIDIKSISFRVKDDNNLKVGVSIYNNGVISIDNNSVLENITELIKEIIK